LGLLLSGDGPSTRAFRDLQTRHAPGDFAYLCDRQVGHHVQKLTGTFQKMEAARGRVSQAETTRTSVRMELQADCYAGVWGHHAGSMKQLDSGDIAEALNAATAIGDDRLQKQTQGRVIPESFTHGLTNALFKRGMDSGRPKDCDTFSRAR
jgi:predicted metalloprotease